MLIDIVTHRLRFVCHAAGSHPGYAIDLLLNIEGLLNISLLNLVLLDNVLLKGLLVYLDAFISSVLSPRE
jgi:hypothetical protein